MNKLTKGSIAAGAAAVLLLGGASTLSYWTADATVGGDTINSGSLKLIDTTDTTCAAALWTLDTGEETAGAPFNPASDTIVPGDTLTKVCTYRLEAVGNHLRATLAVTADPSAPGSINPDGNVTVAGKFMNGDVPVTEITEDNNGNILTATLTLTFPRGLVADNNTQSKTAELTAYSVTLTQVHD